MLYLSITLGLTALTSLRYLYPKIKLFLNKIINSHCRPRHSTFSICLPPKPHHGNFKCLSCYKTSAPYLVMGSSPSCPQFSEINRVSSLLLSFTASGVFFHKGHRTALPTGQCPENYWHPMSTAINSNKNMSYIYNRRKQSDPCSSLIR